jgi:hypothetical protein
MIEKRVFLEEYPFFVEDKDGLVSLNKLEWWRFVHLGYLIDDYFIPFSPFFSYDWRPWELTEYTNFTLTGSITWLFERFPTLDCRIRFNLDCISPISYYKDGELWWGGQWLPMFDLEKLFSKTVSLVSQKIRVNKKFDEVMWNFIERTEFWYQSVDKSLQIEEITDIIFDNSYINRYLHTEFDENSKTIRHTDGSLLFYDLETKIQRSQVKLDSRLKNAQGDIKLFRIDWIVPLDEWLFILYRWFSFNELVLEWFNPEEYKSRYHDILDPLIDW